MAKKIKIEISPEQENYTSSTVYADKTSALSGDIISSNPDYISPSVNNPGAASHPKGKVHALNTDEEYSYWENNYVTRDYVDRSLNFDRSYGPAYRYGIEAFSEQGGRPFEQVEPKLRSGWENFKDKSELAWDHIKDAVRDAYDRLLTSNHSDQ